ncbi:MAG: ATP-binding protein [Pseudomonadota bacterium]
MKLHDSLKFTLIVFLLLVGMGGFIGHLFYLAMSGEIRKSALERFGYHVQVGVSLLEEELRRKRSRTVFLAQSPALNDLIRARTTQQEGSHPAIREEIARDRLASIFKKLIASNRTIDQIRLIGVEDEGREILRVERQSEHIVRVADAELQQKGSSPYFLEALAIGAGDVYQSPIELHVELGRIQEPYKPVIMMATPVFTDQDEIYGMVVVNLSASAVLTLSLSDIPDSVGLYLTNQVGDFLVHPDSAQTFGSVTGSAYGLRDEFPDAFSLDGYGTYVQSTKDHLDRSVVLVGKSFHVGPEDSGQDVHALVSVPIDETLATTRRVREGTLLLAVVLSGIAAFAVYCTIHWHNRPMMKLTAAARDLRGGRSLSEVEWPQDGPEQMRRLRDAFEDLVAALLKREDQIERNAARLATIVDGTTDAIIMIDAHGTIEAINQSTQTLFGYSESDLLGENIKVLMPYYHARKHDSYISSYLSTGKKKIIGKTRKLTGLRKNGETFSMDLRVSEADDHGETKFLGIISDTSERDIIAQMKSEFISTVSHELRTPLASMQGTLGLLEAGVVGEMTNEVRDLVETANNNCRRLIMLINDILDLEKIGAGRMKFSFDHIDLSKVTDLAIRESHGMAVQHKVTIRAQYPSEKPVVLGDPDRLVQVVTNLLSNAIKYSQEQDVVFVSILKMGSAWRLSVSDNGPGIPKEFRSKIFEKFSQADSTASRPVGGTGLGLSICKSIVNAHMGQINFRTGSDGTTFNVDLGIAERSSSDVSRLGSVAQGRVLILEDDATTANLLKGLINSLGYQTVVTSTAEETFERLSSEWFDILTIDWECADEAALQVVDFIHNNPVHSDIPVIAISPSLAETERQDSKAQASMMCWITKPFDQERLNDALQKTAIRVGESPLRVLHVEDDNDQLMVLKNLLSPMAEVDFAKDLTEAKTKLASTRFDVVILDQYLPDGNGLDLIKLIRAQPEPPQMMVYSIDLPPAEAASSVAASVVKTNIDNSELLDKIKLLLRSSRHGHRSGPTTPEE